MDFITECLFPMLLAVALFILTGFGIYTANSYWNCSGISKLGVESQVVAGECLIKEGGHWISYRDYISRNRHKVEIDE